MSFWLFISPGPATGLCETDPEIETFEFFLLRLELGLVLELGRRLVLGLELGGLGHF